MDTDGETTALDLVGAMFHIVDDEYRARRRGDPRVEPAGSNGGAGDELAARARAMDGGRLEVLRRSLAHSLLREVDVRLTHGDLVARSPEELP